MSLNSEHVHYPKYVYGEIHTERPFPKNIPVCSTTYYPKLAPIQECTVNTTKVTCPQCIDFLAGEVAEALR